MKKLRFLTILIILIASCSPSYPWGDEIHKLVTRLAIENLPPKLQNLYIDKLPELEKLSNKPDAEARQDPEKRHEHYIDIEKLDPAYLKRLRREMDSKSISQLKPTSRKYQNFIKEFDTSFFSNMTFPYPDKQIKSLLDTLPPSLNEFEKKYLPEEISQIGAGLYQVKIYLDQLEQAYERNDTESVFSSVGHLSHFVADMHQPFHTTANYKGQYTGNLTLSSGLNRHIHSRYEIGLPRKFSTIVENEVRSKMRPARQLANDQIIPAMIYQMRRGYKLTEEIIAADNRYFKIFPEKKIDWTRYYAFMYEKVGDDMNKQIADAVNLLGDLIFTASASKDAK